MSVIHFKMKSSKNWETIMFDGQVMSVLELKRCIVMQKKLASKGQQDFDLLLTNKTTGEMYREDGFLVPKNTSVEVRRVPATKARMIQISAPPKLELSAAAGDESGVSTAEDNKMMEVMKQADSIVNAAAPVGGMYSNNNRGGTGVGMYQKSFGSQGQPPPGYVCHRCNQSGHFIRNCPTNDDPNFNFKRAKPATGIPRSFLKSADENTDSAAGTVLLPNGEVVVAAANERAFREALGHDKIDLRQRLKDQHTESRSRPDLLCPLCHKHFRNATVTPCCFSTFCEECIRQALTADGSNTCPLCKSNVNPDDLRPNVPKQRAVDELFGREQREQGHGHGHGHAPMHAQGPRGNAAAPASSTRPAEASARPGEEQRKWPQQHASGPNGQTMNSAHPPESDPVAKREPQQTAPDANLARPDRQDPSRSAPPNAMSGRGPGPPPDGWAPPHQGPGRRPPPHAYRDAPPYGYGPPPRGPPMDYDRDPRAMYGGPPGPPFRGPPPPMNGGYPPLGPSPHMGRGPPPVGYYPPGAGPDRGDWYPHEPEPRDHRRDGHRSSRGRDRSRSRSRDRKDRDHKRDYEDHDSERRHRDRSSRDRGDRGDRADRGDRGRHKEDRHREERHRDRSRRSRSPRRH